MAPKRKSKRVAEKKNEICESEVAIDQAESLIEQNLDSSFGLPIPGPDTQAIIDDLAATETTIQGLEDSPHSATLTLSPKSNPISPIQSPQNPSPTSNDPPDNQSENFHEPMPKKTPKRGTRSKQEKLKPCPICPKKVNYFRQHIAKTHGWEGKPLKFMLSVYSTQNNKTPVYECKDCLYRFTHKQRHLNSFPDHEVKRINKDNESVYPHAVIAYMKSKGLLSERGSEVLGLYAEYCREKLKKPLANFQYDAIAKFFRGTHSLKRHDLVADCLNTIKEEKQYTYSSIRKLCFDIKLFIIWMNSGHQKSYKLNKQGFDDAMKLWLKETTKECLKEQKKRSTERFAVIPSMEILCEAQDLVEKFIEQKELLRLAMAQTDS